MDAFSKAYDQKSKILSRAIITIQQRMGWKDEDLGKRLGCSGSLVEKVRNRKAMFSQTRCDLFDAICLRHGIDIQQQYRIAAGLVTLDGYTLNGCLRDEIAEVVEGFGQAVPVLHADPAAARMKLLRAKFATEQALAEVDFKLAQS